MEMKNVYTICVMAAYEDGKGHSLKKASWMRRLEIFLWIATVPE
jgi:hypothetical protein